MSVPETLSEPHGLAEVVVWPRLFWCSKLTAPTAFWAHPIRAHNTIYTNCVRVARYRVFCAIVYFVFVAVVSCVVSCCCRTELYAVSEGVGAISRCGNNDIHLSLLLNLPSSSAVAVFHVIVSRAMRLDVRCCIKCWSFSISFVRCVRAFWHSRQTRLILHTWLTLFLCRLLLIKERRIVLIVLFNDEFTGLLKVY